MRASVHTAPGKIILSGEHAVVHGSPAIVIPTNNYCRAKVSHNKGRAISINSTQLGTAEISIDNLAEIKTNLQKRHALFLQQQISNQDIVQHPLELIMFVAAQVNELKQLATGVDIVINSDIPIKHGYGSSAACIVASLTALANLQQVNLNQAEIIELAKQAEDLQHGSSSGIDVNLAVRKNALYYQKTHIETRTYKPLRASAWVAINTGKRQCSTSDTIAQSSAIIEQDQNILEEFTAVTKTIDQAYAKGDIKQLHEAIRHNHKLLLRIKVVPQKVNNFIEELEKNNASAKISGAGAAAGDNAGIVIALDNPIIPALCEKYNYRYTYISKHNQHQAST